MHRKALIAALTSFLVASLALADGVPRFRGADSSGKFPAKGLKASWPESGPKMLWAAEGLGESYASITIGHGHIYTTGMTEQVGSVFALGMDGKLKWKKEYGKEHSGNGYPGTRSTPTIDGGNLYLLSSMGKAVSLDAKTGTERWSVDLFERFKGENIYFGVSESPLVLDDKVIYTAGGPDASVVALDKTNGNTKWTTEGLSDGAAYCNPRIFDNGKHRQIITLVAKHMVGIDPASGDVIWKTPKEVSYDIHAVSPVFDGNLIYISHGYDHGGVAYELAANGKSVTQKWTEPKMDVHHGGAVMVDGHIYGAASNGTWSVIKAETGERLADIRRLGKGAVVYADGLLYGYTEKGKVVLVDPDPANFKEISSFEITRGEGNHWSHPVIYDSVLYVRHGDVLMAYNVKAGS